jgi:ABC-type branched-subunit amino acid transport system ATPase component/ABC-type branched-subunit amino acid transport system permease subunit
MLAFVLAIVVAGVAGLLTYALVIARLRHASSLARLIATLGVMSSLQALVLLEWGSGTQLIKSILPIGNVSFGDHLQIPEDQLILFLAGLVLALALRIIYSHTDFGLATSAVAENRRAAAGLGRSTRWIELSNWLLGGVLAGLAAIFIAPITGLAASTLVLLILPGLAAALVGRFSSFVLTVVGAIIIGVSQSEASRYVTLQGFGDSIPFLLIVGVIVAGGRLSPARGDLPTRLPRPGDGRINWMFLLLASGGSLVLIFVLSPLFVAALTTTLIFAVAVLSVVVVTGFGGQLSLGQWALAGVGGWIASQFVATLGLPFWAAGVLGIVLTVPVGVVVALPSLRTRGVELAIVTLGLAEVIISMVLENESLTGGFNGVDVGSLHLFGIDLDATTHPRRYAIVALLSLLVAGVVVANVRRGSVGRRLLAVRSDERAAASIGIGVYGVKLYAFGLAAAIAAVAGILAAWQDPIVVFTQFDPFTSINLVMFAVIGGVGWVSGSVIGATLAVGSVFGVLLSNYFGVGANAWLPLATGLVVVANLASAPDGLASFSRMLPPFLRRTGAARPSRERSPTRESRRRGSSHAPELRTGPQRGGRLEITSLCVRYGGVAALEEVSLTVSPGEVVGLIGPNGAGKTTLLDAVTGFVKPSSGEVLLDGRRISGWTPVRISRAGIGRTFKGVQLFDAMSVRENLLAAVDSHSRSRFFSDLIRPARVDSPSLDRLLDQLHLRDQLDKAPDSLPHGSARLVGMARTLLRDPSVVLLDEPTAGLGRAETQRISELVRRMAKEDGRAILLVEHNVPFVLTNSDRVVALDFGHVIATGAPDEIRRDPVVIAAYLGEEVATKAGGFDWTVRATQEAGANVPASTDGEAASQ